ncbi:MAG: 3-mercaptopyruvate sulfurtransferase [Aquamicrobium sp.]|uniref:3-mercaptopyruvate sulfurtransferase n=1 Tax=Aquamicrobium sp. TaxID=1872579 RepID=UPI00349E859D|nr:3-mercaptopyruvate sulfurtransferase [Aquamicrobium sp.]
MMNPLIASEELAALLRRGGVVVLDATFTMPGAAPDAAALYAQRHIPGAIRFDVDAVADRSSDLPHMLPSVEEFAEAVGAMGVSNDSHVVIYDTPGLMSAGRAWWMFRTMGHEKVQVLDGGLRHWQAQGREVTSVVPDPEPARYRARLDAAAVRNKAQLLANLASAAEQVVDARSADRFHARVPEPRPELRAGHIPGSLNLPFDRLTDPATGRLRPADEICALFAGAGLRDDRPVVTSCGSGVTAGALFLALALIGRTDVALYDGSWTEWGRPGDTPVETA